MTTKPLLIGLLALSLRAAPAANRETEEPINRSTGAQHPNIIIMMADDMGLGDTSAYLGVSLIPGTPPITKTLRTPNLEAFAKDSVLFTDAHAPASMCSSTRYSLLTGRYAHRAYLKNQGWLPHGPNTPMIQRDLTTLPEMLQASGYHTACIGKYHVGMHFDNGEGEPAKDFHFHDTDFTKPLLDGPTHHGFDEFFGVTGNTEDPLDSEPRILIRDDRFTFSDRDKMHLIGMKKREGKILAAPDWDLHDLGPLYLEEAEAFLDRQAANADSPFFLYYVPNANHNQRHPEGEFAVPESIAGVPIKGQSRYTNDTPAGEREDMVLENDVVLGRLLEKLRSTDDPRNPGHPLIENTLFIFTSDNGPNTGTNEIPNQESGGLRGKKARIWEGGLRVPFLLHWPGHVEGGTLNRNLLCLTDLYATLATIAGHQLQPEEALDSLDCLAHWTGEASAPDDRPRVFFCNLGPPYSNDALALRQGPLKLIVDGGLAMPSISKGSRGGLDLAVLYDLDKNPLEEGDFTEGKPTAEARALADHLLEIHNRGHARDLTLPSSGPLILDDGWHNLRNDLTGAIGFEFLINENRSVTHLGMWDDHLKDKGVRPPRNVPTEHDRDQPTLGDKNKRSLTSPHTIRLDEIAPNGTSTPVAHIDLEAGSPGELEGEFRYLPLATPVDLKPDRTYRLTMTTAADDGDAFHDPAGFDGLPPQVNPNVDILRALLLRDGNPAPFPAFSDMDEAYFHHRLPAGPTLKFDTP